MPTRPDQPLELTADEKKLALDKLKAYLDENFDLPEPVGNLRLTLLLNFITNELSAVYYNKAIDDAQRFMTERAEDLYLMLR